MEYLLSVRNGLGEVRAMDLTVRASWDAQASVWVAESDDVPGLITEAGDLEALMSKLRVLIPELLEANGALPPDV
jgi:predicted RNase H-like HicB family nuclease